MVIPQLGLLWVSSGHQGADRGCPLYPQKRTCLEAVAMSAMCHEQTFARQVSSRAELNSQTQTTAALTAPTN